MVAFFSSPKALSLSHLKQSKRSKRKLKSLKAMLKKKVTPSARASSFLVRTLSTSIREVTSFSWILERTYACVKTRRKYAMCSVTKKSCLSNKNSRQSQGSSSRTRSLQDKENEGVSRPFTVHLESPDRLPRFSNREAAIVADMI